MYHKPGGITIPDKNNGSLHQQVSTRTDILDFAELMIGGRLKSPALYLKVTRHAGFITPAVGFIRQRMLVIEPPVFTTARSARS